MQRALVYLESEIARLTQGYPPDDIDRLQLATDTIDAVLAMHAGVTNDPDTITQRMELVLARERIEDVKDSLRGHEGSG